MTPTARLLTLALAFVAGATLLSACGSGKPAKYRKKRECDCPKWNHVAPKKVNEVHAAAPLLLQMPS